MTLFKPEVQTAENTGGVVPRIIYNLFTTKGIEVSGDLIYIGEVSYRAKIKSIKLTAALGASTKADLVLIDGQGNVKYTLTNISTVSASRTEVTTPAINGVDVETLTSNQGYQGNYTLALKLGNAISTADLIIYTEIDVIDNV
jgi:hypothetical protein